MVDESKDTITVEVEAVAALVVEIEDALEAFAAECEDNDDCAWNSSIGDQDFYGWTGIDRAVDSEYDSLRKIVDLVGYELEG